MSAPLEPQQDSKDDPKHGFGDVEPLKVDVVHGEEPGTPDQRHYL